MDGNGRWAKKRGLPRTAGHAVGVKVFKNIVFYARDMGLKNLTVYAFSTENWKRPEDEVSKIMQLLDNMIEEAIEDFMNQKVRIRFLGDRSRIPQSLLVKMDKVTEMSKEFDDTTLYIALNYGGRQEIVSSVKRLASTARKVAECHTAVAVKLDFKRCSVLRVVVISDERYTVVSSDFYLLERLLRNAVYVFSRHVTIWSE
jgi:undecaprenyl diphosphate synthase